MNTKIRHHYVWKYYLKSWAANNKVWCLRDSSIFNPSLENIGLEKYFYQLKKLTDKECEIIRKIIFKAGNEATSDHNWNLIAWNQTSLHMEDYFKDKPDKRDAYNKLKKLNTEAEENIHSKIENNNIENLDRLLKGDVRTGDISEFFQLTFFIVMQYFRTKNLQRNFVSNTEYSLRDSFADCDLDAVWSALRFPMAINLSINLVFSDVGYNFLFLHNNTQVEFLTTDQPVINTYSLDDPKERVELYYPLSPSIALLYTNRDVDVDMPAIYLNESAVKYYNNLMVRFSDSQIFASTKNALLNISQIDLE